MPSWLDCSWWRAGPTIGRVDPTYPPAQTRLRRPQHPQSVRRPLRVVTRHDDDIFLRPEGGRTRRPDFRFGRRFPAHAETAGGPGRKPHRSHPEAGSAGQSAERTRRRRLAQFVRVLYAASTATSAAQDAAHRAEAADRRPSKAAEQKKGPAPPPPPPAIPLKFYGYSGALRSTVRRAFFLDGEDIVQAGENETIRNRYKIIRIGVNSAVVEDTVAKNQQTLPLAEEAQ